MNFNVELTMHAVQGCFHFLELWQHDLNEFEDDTLEFGAGCFIGRGIACWCRSEVNGRTDEGTRLNAWWLGRDAIINGVHALEKIVGEEDGNEELFLVLLRPFAGGAR